jgi:hypothetical protein
MSLLALLLAFQTFYVVCTAELIPEQFDPCLVTPESQEGKKLASWSFNQSDSEYFKDETGNGFNVKATSAAASVSGINGQAVNLSTKSHLLTVENSEKAFAVPYFTIEGWINFDKDPCITDDVGGQAKIIDFNTICEGVREGYSFFLMPGGALAMAMPDKWGSYWNVCSSNEKLLPGHWYHVAGTYDGKIMRIFINGILVSETEHSGGYPLPTGNVHIGCQIRKDNSVNSCFFGKIDELGVYDYALSQGALKEIFDSSKPSDYDPQSWLKNERGLTAEYFSDFDMTNCVHKKIVPNIDFKWGEQPPVSEITDNSYAVRWSGFIQPVYSGMYNFKVNSDSPVKVWVNNRLILDKDLDSGIILTAGQSYPVKIEYRHTNGNAYISLAWSNYDVPPDIIPQDRLLISESNGTYPPETNGSGNGLKGEYFNNTDFTGSSLTRLDPRICFDWTGYSPDSSIRSNDFSARWTGMIEPRYTGTYTFHAITDDGVRLWVNDKLIIDEWKGIPMQEHRGTIDLEAWKKYNIKMEYYEGIVRAGAILEWSSDSQKREVIPQSQLYCDKFIETTPIPSPTWTIIPPEPWISPPKVNVTPVPAATPAAEYSNPQCKVYGNILPPEGLEKGGFMISVQGKNLNIITQSDSSGYFEIPLTTDKLPVSIRITKPLYILKYFDITDLDGDKEITSDGSNIKMFYSDFTESRTLNMGDIMKIAVVFNTTRESERYQERYDINSDGAINMLDIFIFASCFS